jgi:hypothetical protein
MPRGLCALANGQLLVPLLPLLLPLPPPVVVPLLGPTAPPVLLVGPLFEGGGVVPGWPPTLLFVVPGLGSVTAPGWVLVLF